MISQLRTKCFVCNKWFVAQRRSALTCSGACRQVRSRRGRATTPPFPPGRFSLIYADPPYHFQTFSDNGQGKSPSRHYETMDIRAICRLPVSTIVAEDCGLAIWVYGPLLPAALQIIEAWGLTYKSDLLTWVKTTRAGKPAFGTGYTTRKNTEQLLYATRGRGLPVLDHGVSQTIFAPRREHSRKPDEAAEALERLFGPVSRIELFARHERLGWTTWGAELPSGEVMPVPWLSAGRS
jgi:N6-adenosine-specific RNA methylase IME4